MSGLQFDALPYEEGRRWRCAGFGGRSDFAYERACENHGKVLAWNYEIAYY
jgi:hypothetical protein